MVIRALPWQRSCLEQLPRMRSDPDAQFDVSCLCDWRGEPANGKRSDPGAVGRQDRLRRIVADASPREEGFPNTMCGRFYAPDEFSEIKIRLRAGDVVPAPNWEPNWNVAPTQDVLAMRFDPAGGRVLQKMYWGLIPEGWVAKPKFPTFNARSETVSSTNVFRAAWAAGRRCVVVSGGFYEWKKGNNGRQPYAIARTNEPDTLLGGLWEDWTSPAGERLRTVTILTTNANELIRPLHDRMPVIIAEADLKKWIGEEPASEEDLKRMLQPFAASQMRLWPVSER